MNNRNNKTMTNTSILQGQGDPIPSSPLIELPIDALDAFDYENAENAKYTVENLREILSEEIRYFRQKNEFKTQAQFYPTTGTNSTSTGGGNAQRGSQSPLYQ